MESTKKLQARVETVSRMIEQEISALAADRNNFASELSLHSLNEHLAELYGQKGTEFFNLGNIADAEREYRKAIELKPTNKGVLLNSILHASEGDWSAAIPSLRMLLHIDPTYEYARTNLAIAYLNYGVEKATATHTTEDRMQALELFYLAIATAIDPEVVNQVRENFAAFHTNLGIRYFEARDPLRCVVCMRRACEALPNERARRNLGTAYAHLALFYMHQRNFAEAIDPFERAEDAGIVSFELVNDYGVALAEIGRLADAKIAFERALKLAPEDNDIRKNLSILQSRETTVIPTPQAGVESSEIEASTPVEVLSVQEFNPEFIDTPQIIYQYQFATA